MLQQLILLTAVLLVGAECRTPTFQPDLYTPVLSLKEKLEPLKDFNLTIIIGSVVELIELVQNCTSQNSTETFSEILSFADETLLYYGQEDFDFGTLDSDWLFGNFSWYLNSEDFEVIHTYLWTKDAEWNDMIEFFYDSGWNGEHSIYKNLRELYDYFECDLEIPSGPRTKEVRHSQNTKRTKPLDFPAASYTQTHPLLELFPKADIKIPEHCKLALLLEILKKLFEANPLAPFDLLNFINKEVNVNPSVHIFWAKLSEPAKGESFRNFRSLPEMKCFVNHIWLKVLRPNPLINAGVAFIWELLGIDFDAMGINLVDVIVSSIEYSIWKTPFPYPSPTELSCASPKFV